MAWAWGLRGSSQKSPANGVFIVPSAMLFDVMLNRATSCAIARPKPAAPAFAAQYAAMYASPVRPASETMVMMRPHFWSIMRGSAAWVQCMTPYRFTCRYGSQDSGVVATNGSSDPKPETPAFPALFTKISTPPASRITEPTAAGSVTSNTADRARPPASVISCTASAARWSRRSLTRTSAPAAASACAMPRPTPWPAPVTSAVRPARSIEKDIGYLFRTSCRGVR